MMTEKVFLSSARKAGKFAVDGLVSVNIAPPVSSPGRCLFARPQMLKSLERRGYISELKWTRIGATCRPCGSR